jgi:hypothetical protein
VEHHHRTQVVVGRWFLGCCCFFILIAVSYFTDEKALMQWPWIHTLFFVIDVSFMSTLFTSIFYPLHLLEEERAAFSNHGQKLSQRIVIFPAVAKILRVLRVITCTAHVRGDRLVQTLEDRVSDSVSQGVKGVLASTSGTCIFMEQLAQELSSENLLFLVESINFSARFNPLFSGMHDDHLEEWMINNRDNIPMTDVRAMGNVYLAIRALYFRYFANGAAYPLNISFRTRERIVGLIGSDAFRNKECTDVQLQEIFDDAKREVFGLLSDSFFRWARTSEFRSFTRLTRSASSLARSATPPRSGTVLRGVSVPELSPSRSLSPSR